MVGNPVISAWLAGGLIWGAVLLGLGAMGGPAPIDPGGTIAQHAPWPEIDVSSDARERALDGDPWGDADLPDRRAYRVENAPDS